MSLCCPQSGQVFISGSGTSMRKLCPQPPQVHAFVSVDHRASIFGGSSVTEPREASVVRGQDGFGDRKDRRSHQRWGRSRDQRSATDVRICNHRAGCGPRGASLRAPTAHRAAEYSSPPRRTHLGKIMWGSLSVGSAGTHVADRSADDRVEQRWQHSTTPASPGWGIARRGLRWRGSMGPARPWAMGST
jgi:hypothetical protein